MVCIFNFRIVVEMSLLRMGAKRHYIFLVARTLPCREAKRLSVKV